jgi:hypothetical protein
MSEQAFETLTGDDVGLALRAQDVRACNIAR